MAICLRKKKSGKRYFRAHNFTYYWTCLIFEKSFSSNRKILYKFGKLNRKKLNIYRSFQKLLCNSFVLISIDHLVKNVDSLGFPNHYLWEYILHSCNDSIGTIFIYWKYSTGLLHKLHNDNIKKVYYDTDLTIHNFIFSVIIFNFRYCYIGARGII